MPEKTLKNICSKITPQQKICFISALIFGFAAHFYKIVNWIPNWDSLVFRYDAQNMLPLGRWFLGISCAFSSFYDLPFVNGMLAVILHAAGAACICSVFGVKRKMTAALTGAVTVTFPTVTSVLLYNYVADGYALSFLFACLAAMMFTREKPKYVTGCIFLTLSCAIYQAYITVTVMLILVFLIDKTVFSEESAKQLILRTAKYLVCGIISMAAYYIILELLLKITHTSLLDYQGLNSTASFLNLDLKSSLYITFHTFFGYFFDFTPGISVFAVLNGIIFSLTAALWLISVIRRRVFGNIAKTLLLILYVCLLPTGSGLLSFINSQIDYHNLMKMGYCIFYILLIILYERTVFASDRIKVLKSWTVFILFAVLVSDHIIIANVSYHKLQLSYEKSYGTLVRIADRIDKTPGAENCSEILVIGSLYDSKPYSDDLPPDMTGTTDGYILRADDETVGQSVLCSALNDYCGTNYTFLYGKRKKELAERPFVKNMDLWPGRTSVAVIDGVTVIKLGTESEL